MTRSYVITIDEPDVSDADVEQVGAGFFQSEADCLKQVVIANGNGLIHVTVSRLVGLPPLPNLVPFPRA
jgi:hypothetical protein